MGKQRKTGPRQALQAIRPHVAGIDLGSREHWVCGPPREDGQTLHVRRTTQPEAELRELYQAIGLEKLPGQTCKLLL